VDVHAVTGATVSCEAILSALETSGQKFASQVLGHPLEPEVKNGNPLVNLTDPHGIYLVGAFVLALILTYRVGFWSRLMILCFNLIVGGIILNAQYSSEQIASILSWQIPALGLTGAFMSVAGIAFLVIIFGNFYCGYICPFGAAQELLGYVVPDKFKRPISAAGMQKARFVKYGVLFVFITVFFVSRNRTTLAADPLISIFNFQFFEPSILLIGALALICSLFYTRFWCLYLCPVGAFLSLLNNVVILKRYLPTKKFGRCEFGLTAKDQMDCLYCDRCRYAAPIRRESMTNLNGTKARSRLFLLWVLATATFVSTVSIHRFLQVIPTSVSRPIVSASSGGEPRDVDLQRIRAMIKQNRLSDREADFYKKVEPNRSKSPTEPTPIIPRTSNGFE
jgi:NosR/NirI family nitrous oxide reductase transcriptional regulator